MWRKILLTTAITLILAQCTHCAIWSGRIVFEDDFNGNSLDLNKWEYQTGCTGFAGYNLQCYVGGTNNVEVKDGSLVITAKPEPGRFEGYDYTSGRIRQKGAGFAYGAYVTRARLPKGKHMWPAFWLFNATSDCKYEEIDILECRGQEASVVHHAGHWGRNWSHIVSKDAAPNLSFDMSADFHEYALLWRRQSLEFYVDDIKYTTMSLDPDEWRKGYNEPCGSEILPFTERSNFIINTAVGGNFFIDYPPLTLEEAQEWPKATFEIDWVRIYQE